MHWIDFTIFILYMIAMLGVGFVFMKKNKNSGDYYVGGRDMKSFHIGLSVVATDVGGGFSIGLGGLGFTMGISGSWMLFTGLLGAWLSAVLLIPKVHKLSGMHQFLSFPQFLEKSYNKKVALIAGIISAIGYLGFTSSQILAGAKLASASFIDLNLTSALIIMGVIAVTYTVMGGLKAVIYTDTIQWLILIAGLCFIGIPLAYFKVGGFQALKTHLEPEFLSLVNVQWQTLLNWLITILPIWFIGMTLYQRIYAAKSEKVAKKAWFVAGLFEYPFMAFMGVLLGMFARVAFFKDMLWQLDGMTISEVDSEMGLPLLLRNILPVGLMGLMMSAYFSAIMSTADSCMLAASGNVVTDILGKKNDDTHLRLSQVITLIIGAVAIWIAMRMPNVLDLMLYSYAFMVSGIFAPVLGALFLKKRSPLAALITMVSGGALTLSLIICGRDLPFGLDPNFYGISFSLVLFFVLSRFLPDRNN
jgi:SSS family solute:Na+ symporter